MCGGAYMVPIVYCTSARRCGKQAHSGGMATSGTARGGAELAQPSQAASSGWCHRMHNSGAPSHSSIAARSPGRPFLAHAQAVCPGTMAWGKVAVHSPCCVPQRRWPRARQQQRAPTSARAQGGPPPRERRRRRQAAGDAQPPPLVLLLQAMLGTAATAAVWLGTVVAGHASLAVVAAEVAADAGRLATTCGRRATARRESVADSLPPPSWSCPTLVPCSGHRCRGRHRRCGAGRRR